MEETKKHHSIDRALYEFKEAGEVRVDVTILIPVTNYLNEMDIPFVKTKIDGTTWEILIGEESDEGGQEVDCLEETEVSELIEELKSAAFDLPGSGARGRSRLAEVEEEVKRRLMGLENIKKAYIDGSLDDVEEAINEIL